MDFNKSRKPRTNDSPLFGCPFCSYTTTNQTNLNDHARRHLDCRPYSCPHCDQTYNTLGGLRSHILKSGLHLGLCLYHCTWCSAFSTNLRSVMKRHLFEKHPTIMPTNQPYIDINEILGIYHPENDPSLLLGKKLIDSDNTNSHRRNETGIDSLGNSNMRPIAPRPTCHFEYSQKHSLAENSASKTCSSAFIPVVTDVKLNEAESQTNFQAVSEHTVDCDSVENVEDNDLRLHHHLIHTGIGLWTRNNLEKYV